LNNKKSNDIVAKIFLAGPLFISLEEMRSAHFNHHKFLQTEKDPEMEHLKYPEFQFPMSLRKFIGIVIKDVSGYNFIKYKFMNIGKYKNIPYNLLNTQNIIVMLYYAAIAFVAFRLGIALEVFLLWIVPYATCYQLLNRIRTYTEHFNIPDKSYNTRSLITNRIASFFISPYNLGYHTEHHLYPFIPNYNLPKIHEYIINNEGET